MARAKHPCLDCPQPIPAGTSRCPTCARTRDRKRGSRQARGYGAEHTRERRRWQNLIQAGVPVQCARCGTRIHPGAEWHLDHADDRTQYLGPSCAHCNLSAAGKAAHR